MLYYLFSGMFLISTIAYTSCERHSTLPIKKDMDAQRTSEVFADWINEDYVMGKFDPEKHLDFAEIDRKYADRAGLYLRKEAYDAFVSMWLEAKKDNISLIIKSATRNFDYQKGIWERKWNGQTILSDGSKANEIVNKKERASKILLYSSMPGTSRHHWGTDFDLNSFNNEYFSKGEGLKIYQWLLNNAEKFGFCQPYSNKSDGRTGYEEEKWHWTYTPTSISLTKFGAAKMKNNMISGFDGHETANELDVVQNYILGISAQCFIQ